MSLASAVARRSGRGQVGRSFVICFPLHGEFTQQKQSGIAVGQSFELPYLSRCEQCFDFLGGFLIELRAAPWSAALEPKLSVYSASKDRVQGLISEFNLPLAPR